MEYKPEEIKEKHDFAFNQNILLHSPLKRVDSE